MKNLQKIFGFSGDVTEFTGNILADIQNQDRSHEMKTNLIADNNPALSGTVGLQCWLYVLLWVFKNGCVLENSSAVTVPEDTTRPNSDSWHAFDLMSHFFIFSRNN